MNMCWLGYQLKEVKHKIKQKSFVYIIHSHKGASIRWWSCLFELDLIMSIHAFIVSRLYYCSLPLAADTWWSFMTSWWRKISLSNSPWKGHCSKYSFMSLCYFFLKFQDKYFIDFWKKNWLLKLFNGIVLLKLLSFFQVFNTWWSNLSVKFKDSLQLSHVKSHRVDVQI